MVLSTPFDAFVFIGIMGLLIVLSAVVAKSPVLGAFAGVLFLLDGAYALSNAATLTPVNEPLSTGFGILAMGFGLYLFLLAAVEK